MSEIQNQLSNPPLHFTGQKGFYRGKVRDVYYVDDLLIMVASDRISAFDHILPRPIPYKGQVLNQLAAYFLEHTKDIAPNWLMATPDPNVSVGISCAPVKVEMVIRGYLAGHAWREYKSGKRQICGVDMPEGLKENDPFPEPIITPATKADEGHDEDISKEAILHQGIVDPSLYEQMENYTRLLFERGSKMAADRNLILVDTKYEFGIKDGKVCLIDEIHTPDSSRYFYKEGFEERQNRGEKQKQLSKEFVREWLMANGFQGLEGQVMPEMDDEIVNEISGRYIALFETLTGRKFEPARYDNKEERIRRNVENWLENYFKK